MQKHRLLNLMVVCGLLPSMIGFGVQTAYAGVWRTAYNIAYAFSDPWYEPHYGAFFSGRYGNAQYFTGPSGDPSDYGSWNWWGSNYNVLLLSKTWLLAPVCSYPIGGSFQVCTDRWDGNQHHAFMLYQ